MTRNWLIQNSKMYKYYLNTKPKFNSVIDFNGIILLKDEEEAVVRKDYIENPWGRKRG